MGNYIRCANFKSRFLIEYKMYINLDSIHARNLKLGMYLDDDIVRVIGYLKKFHLAYGPRPGHAHL